MSVAAAACALLVAGAVVLVVPGRGSPPTRGASGAGTVAGDGARGDVVTRWRRRRRRAAADAAARVLETCESLAAELTAGRATAAALTRAADDWPHLAPVVEAARLGGDVPTALRRAALLPGADDLRLVAAAWQVADQAGGGLAVAVARVGQTLREDRRTRRLVEGELASARATARLVAALPVLTLLLGSGSGSVAFLLGSVAGGACLVAGSGFLLLGLWWIDRIGAAVVR